MKILYRRIKRIFVSISSCPTTTFIVICILHLIFQSNIFNISNTDIHSFKATKASDIKWIRTHLPSASQQLQQRSTQCKSATTKTNDQCVSFSQVGLDGLGARVTRIIRQHLIAAASNRRIDWCPLFSLSNMEAGNTAAFFRFSKQQNRSIYCHAFQSKAGRYPKLLSDTWWNQLRCYETSIEKWLTIAFNCSGVVLPVQTKILQPLVKIRNAPWSDNVHAPYMPQTYVSPPTPSTACRNTCYLNNRITTLPNKYFKIASKSSTPFQNVAHELTRIRSSFANAYDTNRKNWCGFIPNGIHISIHLRSGDQSAYKGMNVIDQAINKIYTLIHTIYDAFLHQSKQVHFHIHTETSHLNVDAKGIYAELGSRMKFLQPQQKKDTALLDNKILIHVMLNKSPTDTLECLRSTDILVLTSSSTFGRLGGLLSNTNTILLPNKYLHSAQKYNGKDEDGGQIKEKDNIQQKQQQHQSLFNMFPQQSIRASILAWSLASLGDFEKKRWYGYKDLNEDGIVDFIVSRSVRSISSNDVGACSLTFKPGKIQNIQEISKDVMNIDESKYFIDQQEIVLDENSFGENCK